MSCLIMTPQIREIAKNLNMNPEECKDWIGYWQEKTGTNLETYPTARELNSFIKESMRDSFSTEEELSNYERGEQGSAESIFGNEGQRAITGENISSKGSEFAKRLTNQGNAEVVTFRGKRFLNAEHAYQSWKTGEFDEKYYNRVIEKYKKDHKTFVAKSRRKPDTYKNANYWLMVEILEEKLRQHPDLVEGITQRGGEEYLERSTHNVTGDKYWESEGENMFLNALTGAYIGIIKESALAQSQSSRLETAQTSNESQEEFEKHFTISTKKGYPARTKENVNWSDATIAFALDFNTAGERLTSKTAMAQNKYVAVSLDPFTQGKAAEDATTARDAFVRNIKEAIERGDIKYDEETGLKLNIAGNGSYTLQDRMPDNKLVRVIKGCLQKLQEEGIKIAEVRSGGQSGADWAGIMAAQELGLPWSVHATANYTWREKNGKDISDKAGFMTRFKPKTQSQPVTSTLSTSFTSTQQKSQPITTPSASTVKVKFVAPQYNSNTFNTKVGPISEATRRKVDEIFRGDIQRKRDRIELISSLFSSKVTKAFDEEEDGFINAINNAEDGRTRDKLQRQYDSLNEFYVIKKVTPREFFLDIYKELKMYANRQTLEMQIAPTPEMQEDLKVKYPIINYDEDANRGELRERRVEAFKEITDDIEVFMALAENACRLLRTSELIDVDIHGLSAEEVADDKEGHYLDNAEDQIDDEPVNDKQIKKDWGENVRNLSSRDSLSQKTRQVISHIPRMTADGKIDSDDLGFYRYLNPDEVHTTLNNVLMNMTEPSDMIPMLKEYAKNNPWINRLIEILENDDENDGTINAQFYSDFRKNFINYGIQLWPTTEDGATVVKTRNINEVEGIDYLIRKWRDGYEEGIVLNTQHSIYDGSGRVNSEKSKENAEKGIAAIKIISNRLKQIQRDVEFSEQIPAIQALLQEEDIQRNIITLCQMIGINTAPETIIKALSYSEEIDALDENNNWIKRATYPKVKDFLGSISTILTGIKNGKVADVENGDGTISHGDLITFYKGAYSTLAGIIAKVYNESVRESSVRENGNSYYSHVVPNFLTDLLKELKNAKNLDDTLYQQMLEKKYGKCEWFKKDGEWLNDWLGELATNPQAREQLELVEELHFGGVEYSQLSDLQYTIGLMGRYWSNPNQDYAWYHVPIMSNSDSAEFIKFRRIHGTNWKDTLLSKFTNVVAQEYRRIKLVQQRVTTEGTREIGNFDKRGLEFCFFPALNTSEFSYPVMTSSGKEQVDINGNLVTRTFFEQLDYLIRTDKTKVDDFIKGELEKLIDKDFEKALKDWHRLGLFSLTGAPKGLKEIKYKYLPGNFAPNSVANTIEGISGNDKMKGAKEILEGMQLWTDEMEEALKVLEDLREAPVYYDYDKLNTTLDNIKTTITEIADQAELSKSNLDAITARLNFRDVTREKLMEYFYNSMFATSQVIQLTTTDLAFYKNLADFQKRFKEVHSPALRLNTKAKFNGETIGREFEKTIYLVDEEIISTIVEYYKDLLKRQYEKGEISAYTYASMMAKYGASNFEKETGKVIKEIDPETGKTTEIPQTIKYFKVESVDPITGKKSDVLVKTDKVNVTDAQAYRCLSSYRAVSGMIGDWTDEKERAYRQIIDLDGNYRRGNLKTSFNTLKGFAYTQVDQILGYNEDGKPIWHKIPTQHKNSEFLILTAYSAVAGDLAKSADPNSKVARAVNKLKVINAFMETHGIDVVQFETAVKVGDQGPINLNNATSEDEIEKILNEATKIASGGDPAVVHTIPYSSYGIQQATPDHFYNTTQAVGTQIRRLITSDIDPKATFDINGKRYSKASWLKLYNALINQNVKEDFEQIKEELSDNENVAEILQQQLKKSPRYALDLLKAVTLNENGEFIIPLFESSQSRRTQELLTSIIRNRISKQKARGGSLIQASEYGLSSQLHVQFKNDDSSQGIEYIECYMPATAKEFFDAYMKKDGTIDIDAIPDDLKKAIGYRIPTEDKYSMAPLKVVGFLPQENGGAIMLPAEITTISGSDFDIDKLFILLPNFETVMDGDKIIGLKKIEYDINALPDSKQNTREARDNMIFDLMWAQLTHPDTVTKLLNPGGFDAQKISSRICTILSTNDKESLTKLLSDDIADFNPKNIKDENTLVDYLLGLDAATLDMLAQSSQKELNPLSPRTQVIAQQQNMNAANLVGIYANHNSNHAIAQQTELALSPEGSFMFNGKILTSLHGIKTTGAEYISRNNAGYLALSVDDTKEKLLYGINQNVFTADVTMLLSRLGYSPTEIGILLNQPIIKDMTTAYFNRRGETKAQIIDKVIQKYQTLGGHKSEQISYNNNFRHSNFNITSLATNIMLSHSEIKSYSYYENQMAVGYLFKHMMKSADTLTEFVNITKIDSSKNGAGPTVADMEEKRNKLQLFMTKMRKFGPYFPLEGATLIEENLTDEQVQKSLVPAVQTFYTYGIERPLELLEKFFPYSSQEFSAVCKAFGGGTRRGELSAITRNSIYENFIAYILSGANVFKGENALETRRQFIHNFTRYFREITTNPEYEEILKGNRFIRDLSVRKAKKGSSLPILTMQQTGSLTSTMRDSYMGDWEALVYSDKPALRELAINLARYCFFRSGMAFGNTNFSHLMPVAVKEAVPEYIGTLRYMIDPSRASFDITSFMGQYIRNHLDNKELVINVPDGSTIQFVDKNGSVVEDLVIRLTDSSPAADKKITLEAEEGDTHIRAVSYISARVGNQMVYYERDLSKGNPVFDLGYDVDTSGAEVATLAYYKRMTPLGQNVFLEYEYGVPSEDVQSALPYIRQVEDSDNDNAEVTTESFNFEIKPEDDLVDTGEDINTYDYSQARDEMMQDAFRRVFGQSLDYVKEIPRNVAFSPSDEGNIRYTDAEDNEIC